MVLARVFAGFVIAVTRSGLPLREKALAEAMLARWFVSDNRWRMIGGEMKRRLRERAHVGRASIA
jgi:hypothetical protein